MSIVSEIVSIVGFDNLQTLVGLALMGLVGKSSWDLYNAKSVAKKSDVNETNKMIRSTIEKVLSSIDDIKDKQLKEVVEKVEALESELVNVHEKISGLQESHDELKVEFDELKKSIESRAHRVSRAEIRRMKETGE